MEAAASAPPWIPEDDLRLKKAMEAGASLEALAKGAVRFSRKFSVRELRERWSSLLYDADISAEASSRMLEVEGCNSSAAFKSSRVGSSRDSKRKGESIRKHYYAMQKRLRTSNSVDPNSYHKKIFDPNFLFAPHLDNGEALEENFGVGDHNQPLFMDCNGNESNAADAFRAGECVSIGNHGVEGVVREACPNGFVEQVSLLPNGLGEDTFFHDPACEDLPTQGDDLIDFANALDVEDIGPSHASTDEPLWKTIEDVPAPEMPIDVSLGVNGEDAKKTLVVPDDADGENIGSSQYEVVHSEAMLNDREVCDELNRSVTISGGDYADIYLTNEDELTFMDVNGKESMDKSSYESLKPIPLSSPKDVHEYVVPDPCQPQKLISDSFQDVSHNVHTAKMPDSCQPQNLISETCQDVSHNVHAAEMDVAAKPSHSLHDEQRDISSAEANNPSSTSVPNPLTPELHEKEMICTLNTEDPEIPCNDDIFPPTGLVHAVVQPTLKEASGLASSTGKRKCDQQTITLTKEEDPAQPFKVPRMVGHDTITENSPNHALVSFGIKAAYGDSNSLASVSKHDKNVPADPSQCRSAHQPPKSITNRALKEEGIVAPSTVAELAPVITEPGSTKMTFLEPEANPSALDCEESEEESDDDVDDDDADIPYFSDIEQMILEMDLCPDDQDSYFSKIASAYQDEDSKRRIMRLEQCARSSMQRDLASKGALAVLYGRHVKEYIKKTEVILGRSTEDNEVDIDLGKEGLHNKISRRQAVIKMEGDGSFFLKNLGKGSIFLNGKEVTIGQLVSLSSSNLIEIREMAFVFEINHKYTKFEWSPGRGP